LVAVREGAKSLPRMRESPQSFALSIPSPALITQVDEHSLELYIVTPDGIAVTKRVHAAVLVCVKTAAILGAPARAIRPNRVELAATGKTIAPT